MKAAALALALGAASLLGAAPSFEARVTVFQSGCSDTDRGQVEKHLRDASAILQKGCGLSLTLTAWTALPTSHAFCHAAPQREAAALKTADPQALALFLLPTRADLRLSWAVIDVSAASACDSPQEPRFLKRFGALFFTDIAWTQRPALLLAHEVLHALTQRGHPNGAPYGHVMADHLADMGPQISQDWCACARQSPYLRKR